MPHTDCTVMLTLCVASAMRKMPSSLNDTLPCTLLTGSISMAICAPMPSSLSDWLKVGTTSVPSINCCAVTSDKPENVVLGGSTTVCLRVLRSTVAASGHLSSLTVRLPSLLKAVEVGAVLLAQVLGAGLPSMRSLIQLSTAGPAWKSVAMCSLGYRSKATVLPFAQ